MSTRIRERCIITAFRGGTASVVMYWLVTFRKRSDTTERANQKRSSHVVRENLVADSDRVMHSVEQLKRSRQGSMSAQPPDSDLQRDPSADGPATGNTEWKEFVAAWSPMVRAYLGRLRCGDSKLHELLNDTLAEAYVESVGIGAQVLRPYCGRRHAECRPRGSAQCVKTLVFRRLHL